MPDSTVVSTMHTRTTCHDYHFVSYWSSTSKFTVVRQHARSVYCPLLNPLQVLAVPSSQSNKASVAAEGQGAIFVVHLMFTSSSARNNA